ncbi:hypothetical protein [Pelosinus sp. IPA-1]|uniref:hypothetical protein n=1 Tax=Pelosinus sp. IPA-1 TaxID=3029569 RepID=UPI0024361AF5|nr:hypothetical protein [Pelosinus sp. IPA-1]GMB00873.1 hypothetical protein PIPA1_36720 [Pelosinus sp. IPA-1]
MDISHFEHTYKEKAKKMLIAYDISNKNFADFITIKNVLENELGCVPIQQSSWVGNIQQEPEEVVNKLLNTVESSHIIEIKNRLFVGLLSDNATWYNEQCNL